MSKSVHIENGMIQVNFGYEVATITVSVKGLRPRWAGTVYSRFGDSNRRKISASECKRIARTAVPFSKVA